jgi:lipid-A-disaccharide synthase-like uncharacterized protein
VENNAWYFAIGGAAQGLFSARMLVQWLLSEKKKKSVSPAIYWQLSLLASFLFFIYGWLRGDFAIILGQVFSYYIYIWNLDSKERWQGINVVIRWVLLLMPVVALGFVLYNGEQSVEKLFGDIPLGLLLFGSAGQIIFTFRFIYQWWYSRSRGESLLPAGFWLLSLLGSFMIVAYGVFRQDPVLVVGQSFGFITYARNLWLIKKNV